MTQEEKSILLKDLCARLSYGVIVYDYNKEETREIGLGTLHDIMFNDLECKPYLRPMSSMTEEENKEIEAIYQKWFLDGGGFGMYVEVIDWLNAHHFDYRGLIDKGLALEAPEGMYN